MHKWLQISALIGILSLVLQPARLFVAAAQTNTHAPHVSSVRIKTEFVEGAKLSAAEINQVAALAKQCGLPDVAYIRTFHYLPGGGIGISATSQERKVGRNISYDYVMVNRTRWGYPLTTEQKKKMGEFWVAAPYPSTTHLREFVIGKKTIRLTLGDGADAALADRVIPLITARQVHCENPRLRHDFETLDVSQPIRISKNPLGPGYELELPGMNLLDFKEEKGQVIVLGISSYVI